VAVFSDGDYHVERGRGRLSFIQNGRGGRDIGRFGRFGEEAFVTSSRASRKRILDFVDRAANLGAGEWRVGGCLRRGGCSSRRRR